MKNNLQILFFIFCVSSTLGATRNSQNDLSTTDLRQKQANYISSQNQVNHIDRKQLTGGSEVLRKEKNHKLVLKELVQQNSYEIIAQDNSTFLKNALKYSQSYQHIMNFSQEVVNVLQSNDDYHLRQTVEETLTKLLTLLNLNYIGQREDQFFYLYDYLSFRSFLHDLNEKRIRFENQCKQQENQDRIECIYNLSQTYKNLFLHFQQFQLAQVTGPEFKDKYQEEIDSIHFEQIDYDQIQEIAQMHVKSIQQDAQNTMKKLKKIVQDLVARRNNVLSVFHESKPSKQKIYENVINLLNLQIVVKNSQDLYLNFYAYHFVQSLEKALSNGYLAEKNQKKKDLNIPYKCYVYERASVETFMKDAFALKDYLQITNNKAYNDLYKNIEYLIDFYNNLDGTYSENYLLEQIKVFQKPNVNRSNTMVFNSNVQQLTLQKIKAPSFVQKEKSQKLLESEKEKIRNDIMNFQQEVPKSDLVKLFVEFRTLYEIAQVHKKRTCERSFYEFLNQSGSMFLGSTPLNYLGDEMHIYGYIYRFSFHDKLIKSIFQLQNCLDFLANVQNLQQKLQEISVRVQQLYRLNHDFIELKIEYQMDYIKKQLKIKKAKDQLDQSEIDQIKKFKQDLKQNFMKQKNIEENLDVVLEKGDQKVQQQPLPLNPTHEYQNLNDLIPEGQGDFEYYHQEIQLPINHNQHGFMNDIDDQNEYDRPLLQLNNLKKSKLYNLFQQLDQQDQQNQYINRFKSYKKNIHFFIKAINEVNANAVTNQFGESKKGIWISIKYPSNNIQELLQQVTNMEYGVTKIYSQESDNMISIMKAIKTFIKQNIHSTRGFYYEKEFIPNQKNDQEEKLNVLLDSKLDLERLKGSKLYPLLQSNIHHLNKILLQNNDLKEELKDQVNELLENLRSLINDENLELVKKNSKRLNQKLTYGKFKFNKQKVLSCLKNFDEILSRINDKQSEEFLDLQDDINALKIFFNNLKNTRKNYYESTDAVFDEEGKFLKFEDFESQISEDQNQYQEQMHSSDSIIQEQSIEESDQEYFIPEQKMNIEKIKHSKLYQPLKNIQESKFKSQQQLDLYNEIANEFNQLVGQQDLVQSAIRKIKKQKVKIGSYHYNYDKANTFLKHINQLWISVEEQDQDEYLKQDLKFVGSIFNTFLSTRQFYYEAFSATLLDKSGNEISKPLYNVDFDKLRDSKFSMISNTGLDIQNALQHQDSQQSSEETSEDQFIQNKNSEQIQVQNEEQKAKKIRRIYVIDIVACEDCIKKGYVQVEKK